PIPTRRSSDLLGKTVIDSIEAPRQTFGLGQYQLPCGNIGRVFSSCLQSREEALQRRRNACGGTCQQRIELADLALVGLDVAVERGAAAQLSREKLAVGAADVQDRKSTRLNSSHVKISYAVFCLKKKKR